MAGFPIKIRVAIRGFPSQRAFSRASKTSHGEMGRFYHEQLIPKHFQPGAEQEYRFRRRAPGYRDPLPIAKGRSQAPLTVLQRLVRQGKALAESLTTPLVVKGTLRRLVTQQATVRAFPSRATIEMSTPVYAPARPRTLRYPPIADEATRVSGRERGVLAKVLADSLDREQQREYAKVNRTIPIA